MAMLKKRPIRRKAKRAPRRKTAAVSVAVKKYVKKIMHTDQENKIINTQVGDNFGGIAENTAMNMYPVLPYTGYSTIGQSITAAGRIGNEVKVRKVMLKYVLRPNPYDLTTNSAPAPQEIDLFLGNVKQISGFLPSAIDVQNLFQSGSTSFVPAGNLTDLIADVNRDYWNIKKRWSHKVGYATSGGTGSSAAGQSFTNNDFQLNVIRRMDITKLCPKTLKFNDSTNTLQGPNLFFFYQAVRADGQVNGATALPCRIDYWIDLHYEDA